MASVRAYKIAEELGIDRVEFVERARELGIELKNAMASVDDDQAQMLRERLGARRGAITEARLEAKGKGAAVIRRRKRTPAEDAALEPAPPLELAAAAPEPALLPEPEPVLAAPEGEPSEPEAEPDEAASPAPAAEPERARPAAAAAAGPRAAAAPRGESVEAELLDRKGSRRKQFKEVVNLREQEQIARQVTSRPGQRHPAPMDPRGLRVAAAQAARRSRGPEEGRGRGGGRQAGAPRGARRGRDQRGRAGAPARRQGGGAPGAPDEPRHHGLRQLVDRRGDGDAGGPGLRLRGAGRELPGGGVPRRARRGGRGRARAAAAGRHGDGPRRPRQDLAPRRDPRDEGGGGRGRRHHPAHRRLPGRASATR